MFFAKQTHKQTNKRWRICDTSNYGDTLKSKDLNSTSNKTYTCERDRKPFHGSRNEKNDRFYVFLPEVNEENKRLQHRVRLLDLY